MWEDGSKGMKEWLDDWMIGWLDDWNNGVVGRTYYPFFFFP